MEFVSVSKRWKVLETKSPPEAIARSLLRGFVEYLPSDALGHAKLYIEYDGGALFASTTLFPPEPQIRCQGEFRGGGMVVNVTLIFGELAREVLSETLVSAHQRLERTGLCRLEEIGVDHGSP